MRKTLKAIVVVMLLVSMLCSTAMAASYGAKVLTSSMSVYGSNKEVLGKLGQGTSFKVTAVSGNWARISYKGNTMYAKLDKIIFNKSVKAVATRDTTIKFVTRESYSQNLYYKATLAAGTPVYVVGKDGGRALVYNADRSALGYVSFSALKKS